MSDKELLGFPSSRKMKMSLINQRQNEKKIEFRANFEEAVATKKNNQACFFRTV